MICAFSGSARSPSLQSKCIRVEELAVRLGIEHILVFLLQAKGGLTKRDERELGETVLRQGEGIAQKSEMKREFH